LAAPRFATPSFCHRQLLIEKTTHTRASPLDGIGGRFLCNAIELDRNDVVAVAPFAAGSKTWKTDSTIADRAVSRKFKVLLREPVERIYFNTSTTKIGYARAVNFSTIPWKYSRSTQSLIQEVSDALKLRS
jgi:hypothetical protein